MLVSLLRYSNNRFHREYMKDLCDLSNTPLKWHKSHDNNEGHDTYGMPPGC